MAVSPVQIAKLQETMKAKEKEISVMREQAVERTNEIRALVAARDLLHQDVVAVTDRALKYE